MSFIANVVAARRGTSWVPYAALLILFWGIWGAFSSAPMSIYGYPEEMVYTIWAFTMLIPAYFSMRGQKFDRRGVATKYGLLAGLAGAGGQLLLFKALTMGPAYIVFPIIALSPTITVLLAVVVLKERVNRLAALGVMMALIAIVAFSISSGDSDASSGPYLLLAVIICVVWGVQSFFVRKAATVGVNAATTFGWMTISAIVLVPVAIVMMGGLPGGLPWQAPALTAATQVLNAIGALFLVMALSRGKASIVTPTTSALAPVLTTILSLAIYQTLPSIFQTIGIVLALTGSTLMIYANEGRGEKRTPGAVAGGSETSSPPARTGDPHSELQ